MPGENDAVVRRTFEALSAASGSATAASCGRRTT